MATARARKATSPPSTPTRRRRPTKPWWKWSPKATTPTWKSSSRRAPFRSSTFSTACAPAFANCASSRCMCAAAHHNIGTDLILDLIVDDMPTPTERGAITAFVNGTEAHRPDRRKRPGLRLRLQDHRRPVRRTHHLLPGGYRHHQERLPTCRTSTRARPSAWRTSAARTARPCSPSPNCTPAISAPSPSSRTP